jgi:dUTP pyrophosphatase
MRIKIKKLSKFAQIPEYATPGAAGFDLHACLDAEKDFAVIEPGHSMLIPTGLSMQLPIGCELQIRPRSGLALKNQVTVLNSPGTIDCDYRGPIGIILINHGQYKFVINHGDRIAQGVFNKLSGCTLKEVDSLEDTFRGKGGFGSTGINNIPEHGC